MIKKRVLLTSAVCALTAWLPITSALAQAWPTKPVTLVVSYPPGGGADIMARLIGPRLGEALGQPVIVENRPGGSGQLAAGAVTRAPADGYTLLFDASSYAVTPTLFPASPYKGGKAFRTIAVTALFPNVVLVNPGFSARTVAELVTAARKAPDSVAFASSGNGSAQHLAGVLFEQSAGVQMMHVPYKGGGPALNDVMGGQVPVFFGNVASTLGHIQSGRLRALAVTGRERSKALPDVPTVAQAGVAGFESYEWNGLFAPVGTPDAVVERLQAAVRQAMAAPEVRERITALGGEPFRGDANEAARFVAGELDRMAKLVKARAITVE
ncbi:tripartite tricarboxylate transporter substrate binding protein [Aquincola tertiaricarbonis]|uniref:Tripartite tricarboxylate transporter substrate binding protein n=1 Tax=Aquincola tertiaricarbonis TaxID=391953 RepID=A0ABY4S1R3_AQUTE|nr:tripartite tricarboxylate transporter substrate binding protein [Aquincola tertiaricarbonis]URI05867.1 tripartite tricarboxylate transporter substrate binding protein [Aquincola tertiaricarbonis]